MTFKLRIYAIEFNYSILVSIFNPGIKLYFNIFERLPLTKIPSLTYSNSKESSNSMTIDSGNFDVDELILKNEETINKGGLRNPFKKLRLPYTDRNELIYRIKQKRFTLSPFFSTYIPGINNVQNKNSINAEKLTNLETRNGFSYRVGINAGVNLYNSPTLTVAALSGVEYSSITAKYSMSAYNDGLEHIDPVDDAYLRLIKASNFEQDITYSYTDIPFLINVRYGKFQKFDLLASIGVKYSMLNTSKFSSQSDITIQGSYSQYRDLIIANFDEYNFDFVSEEVNSQNNENSASENLLCYQFGIAYCKDLISDMLQFYVGPYFLFYNEPVSSSTEATDLIDINNQISTITSRYEKSILFGATLQFGVIYNFSMF